MKLTSVAFHHFGCKLNFAEASALSGKLKEQGFEIRNFHEEADVYVISTCVVTAVAEKKCRAAIRQAHKLNPQAKIAVIGCFPELKPGELSSMDGVDLVLGHTAKFSLPEEIARLNREEKEADHDYHGAPLPSGDAARDVFIPSWSYGDRTRSFLKVQDGCDYYCTYCTIPLARGRSRSDTIGNVVRSAREIIAKGIREIILTGVNIGDFGRHTGETFEELIRALDGIDGITRIRISSIEPDLLTPGIIEFIATSKSFLPHFHIPLQSGCDKILRAMHRRYGRELYRDRVSRIRALMPHACIAADVIVGFPGESDDDFGETLGFLQGLDISYLHVFPYSKRENTLAAKSAEPVSDAVKKERSDILHRLSAEKKSSFYRQNRGREMNVLFESDNTDGFMHGWTENYIKVKRPYDSGLVNRVVRVVPDRTDAAGEYIV